MPNDTALVTMIRGPAPSPPLETELDAEPNER